MQVIASKNEILLCSSDDRSLGSRGLCVRKKNYDLRNILRKYQPWPLYQRKSLLSSDSKRNVLIWDITNGKIIENLKEIHPNGISSIVHSPIQNLLIFTSKSLFETNKNTLIALGTFLSQTIKKLLTRELIKTVSRSYP